MNRLIITKKVIKYSHWSKKLMVETKTLKTNILTKFKQSAGKIKK